MAKLVAIRGGKSPKFCCYVCHEETQQRQSRCPSCGRFDTLICQNDEEPEIGDDRNREARRATEITFRQFRFYSSGSKAFDEVLGGGFVRPSSTLVYGQSGTGKSTRALSIALELGRLTKSKVLYGSAEMPAEHIRLYAERLGASREDLARLWVQDSSDALDLLANIEQIRPSVVVWDSIQRMTWEGDVGDAELRQVVHHAIDAGKHFQLVTILLSQVTKDQTAVGPSGIEHDVDVVVRLSRAADKLIVETPHKNRFASTPRRAEEPLFTSKVGG